MEELIKSPNKDTLTGVYNRYFLEEFVTFELQRKERYGGHLSFVICDLDNFKKVNDSYGHLKGDEILVHFARLLEKSIRSSDIVVRYGGDEFILVLTDTPKEMACYVAERIINSVMESKELQELGVGVSIGISGYPEDAKSLETLLKKADHALYDAKRKGKGRFSFYSSDINLKPIIPAKEFVGREEILKTLTKLYESKEIKTILIEGPVGIGKTRLIEESLKHFPNVTKVRASAFSKHMPYFEIRENLMHLYKSDRAKFQNVLLKSEDFVQSAVYSFLPHLAFKETSPIEDKYNLFEGIRAFYSNYYENEPFIFFLDDIQWVSSESLELFLYLTEREQMFKSIFIKRAEEDSEDLSKFLEVLKNLSHIHRLDIPPLSPKDTKKLIQTILGRKYPLKLFNYIQETTQGNPFFIEETLRELFEQGYIQVLNGEWIFTEPNKPLVSNSMEDVVLRKIHDLPKIAIRLLEIMTLWDSAIDVRTLSMLSEVDEGEALHHLDKLEYLNLVSTQNSLYYLSAGIIRNIILKEMTAARKTAIYRRLASTLEHILPENNEYIEKIAYLYFNGGEKKKALKYLKKAYERAKKIKSLQFEKDLLEKILSIEEDPTLLLRLVYLKMDTESTEKAMLILENYIEKYGESPAALQLLSEIMERRGEVERAIEILNRIDTKDEIQKLKIQSDKAWLLMSIGKYTESQKLLEELLNNIKDKNTKEYYHVLHYLATLYYTRGQYIKSIELSQKVIEFHEKHERIPFGAMNTLALSLRSIEKYDEALKVLKKAIGHARKRGTPHSLATLVGNLALVYWDQYQYSKAKECFEESISILTSMRAFDTAAFNMNHLLEMLFESGLIETGDIPISYVRKILNRIHAFTSQSSTIETRIVTYINEIEYANLKGNYKEALYWGRELLYFIKDVEEGPIKNYGYLSAAYTFISNCLLKEALAILRHVLRSSKKLDTLEWDIYTYIGIYEIMKKAGKPHKAKHYFNILVKLEDKLPLELKIILWERLFKSLAENGEKEKAREYYKKLIKTLKSTKSNDKLKTIEFYGKKYKL